MTDQETITDAYQDALKSLFSIYLDAYIVAQQQADKDIATKRFQSGIGAAREVRDKALTLL